MNIAIHIMMYILHIIYTLATYGNEFYGQGEAWAEAAEPASAHLAGEKLFLRIPLHGEPQVLG